MPRSYFHQVPERLRASSVPVASATQVHLSSSETTLRVLPNWATYGFTEWANSYVAHILPRLSGASTWRLEGKTNVNSRPISTPASNERHRQLALLDFWKAIFAQCPSLSSIVLFSNYEVDVGEASIVMTAVAGLVGVDGYFRWRLPIRFKQ